MKQLVPLLSSMSICALLLCLCLLLLPVQSQPLIQPTQEQCLFSYSMEQLDKITFEEFGLLNTGSQLVLEELEELPLLESRTKALLALLANCWGGVVPVPDAEPVIMLTLHLVDGQEKSLSLYHTGDTFILSDGTKAVTLPYAKAKPLLWQAENYAEPTILSMELPSEGHFLLSGKLHPEPLQFSYYIEDDEAVALLNSPETADIKEEQLLPFLSSLKELQAVQVVALTPNAVDLQTYDLSVPFCILHGDLYGQSFTLSASQPQEDGKVYLMKEGVPLIYEADLSQLPWLTLCKESLIEERLFSPDYEDSTALTLSTTSAQYRFTKWAGQVLCNGKSVDERQFYELYRLATTLIPYKAALFPAKGDILLQISIAYTNPSKAKDNILFYPYDEETLLLSLNGNERFVVEKEQVEDIISSLM